MTETFKLATATATIAAQTISVVDALGATVTLAIKDIDTVPSKVEQAACPLLTPRANDFVTDLRVTRDSFGADAALKTVEYVLHYRLYYAPVGQATSLFEHYGDMVDCYAAILLYFANHTALSGTHEFMIQTAPHIGAVQDDTGQNFHGADIAFAVKQFLES